MRLVNPLLINQCLLPFLSLILLSLPSVQAFHDPTCLCKIHLSERLLYIVQDILSRLQLTVQLHTSRKFFSFMSKSEITAWTSLDQDLVQVQIMVWILDSVFQQLLCWDYLPQSSARGSELSAWPQNGDEQGHRGPQPLPPEWTGSSALLIMKERWSLYPCLINLLFIKFCK